MIYCVKINKVLTTKDSSWLKIRLVLAFLILILANEKLIEVDQSHWNCHFLVDKQLQTHFLFFKDLIDEHVLFNQSRANRHLVLGLVHETVFLNHWPIQLTFYLQVWHLGYSTPWIQFVIVGVEVQNLIEEVWINLILIFDTIQLLNLLQKVAIKFERRTIQQVPMINVKPSSYFRN